MSMVADSGRFREAAAGFSQQWQVPYISAMVCECTGAPGMAEERLDTLLR